MVVKIEKFDHQGRGIAKANDKIIFVENALPDEIVDINITKNKKKIAEAKVVNYIEKSVDRIDSICPFYNVCGGCNLMHINYNNQLKYKENKVKEVITKFANLPSKIIKPIVGSCDFNYRNKTTFHILDKIGFYCKGSNQIVDIDNCLISDNKINNILKKLKEINLDNIYEIVVRTSKNIDNNMLVINVKSDIEEKVIIQQFKNLVDAIIIYQNKKYKPIYGDGFIYELLGDYKFKISPDSFFQVNTKEAEVLYNKVLEYLEPNRNDSVLDLYCGTGTIGIYISKYVNNVKGIEINKYAVEDANYNKEINDIKNISFECLDASNIEKIKDKFDSVIVDPPRSGLDKKTVDYLINLKAKRIVYVSCDPVTLARDLKYLSEIYDIIEITPVDMFPNTHHVESVTLLNLKKLNR